MRAVMAENLLIVVGSGVAAVIFAVLVVANAPWWFTTWVAALVMVLAGVVIKVAKADKSFP